MPIKPSKSTHLVESIATLNDIIEQTFYLEQKVYEWSKKVEKNKAKISEALGSRQRLSIRVDDNLSFDVVKKVDTQISFYEDQLKKSLDSETFLKVVDKRVVVTDFDGLIKFLRKNKVKPKEFKKFIETENTVNSESIDELLELGEIEIKDLHGCFKADFKDEIKVKKNT